MSAAASSATACFLSPLPPPRRPRHFLRHLARAAVTKPEPASASSLALPSPWLWARRLCELVPAEAGGRLLSSAAGSLIVALASASLVLGDTGAASAFVVSTPRKLQADELATVRLFQENTPSVVYITNLAVRWASASPFLAAPPAQSPGLFVVCLNSGALSSSGLQSEAGGGPLISSACYVCRQDAFTLDVLEVPQGSGSGFVWDKSGHIVTNFHVIRGASDLRLVRRAGYFYFPTTLP
jgi:S1-C subfamily serine protease